MQPFDLVRAAFYLIAAVIGVQLFIVLAASGACLYMALLRDAVEPCKGIKGELLELLNSALAVGLALLGAKSLDKK